MPEPRQLFESCRIGPVTLRNRSIRAAAFEGMAPGHRPSPQLLEYHRSVAAGGVGMTTVAYAAVEQSGLSFPHQLLLQPGVVAELRPLTDAIHAHGAKASIQIGHCGNMAHSRYAGGRAWSPSGRPNLYGPHLTRAMDETDITRVAASHGTAVRLARDAGFDAVEVHAGHGYLISQFLSPYTNRRRDGHGGPLAHRMRVLRAVMAEVRQAAGDDVAVLVKMNLSDGFPGGQDLAEAVTIAQALEEAGADALVLSGGFVSRTPMYVLRGPMPIHVMSAVMTSPLLKYGLLVAGRWMVRGYPYTSTYFLEDALVVRREVQLPLVYVGGADSREAIDRVLSAGFDAVAMARALLREPDFVNRLAAEPGHRSPCDHCNYCAAQIYTRPMACHVLTPPDPAWRRAMARDGIRC